ncbi:MAG: hypothetical protein ACI835_004323 [Planctomycetota bacterium]|jgi:hypothetical protein
MEAVDIDGTPESSLGMGKMCQETLSSSLAGQCPLGVRNSRAWSAIVRGGGTLEVPLREVRRLVMMMARQASAIAAALALLASAPMRTKLRDDHEVGDQQDRH